MEARENKLRKLAGEEAHYSTGLDWTGLESHTLGWKGGMRRENQGVQG